MATQSCIQINNEWDIVKARQRGRNLAKELGFGIVDQARVTTTVSELARNIFLYAKTGEIIIEPIYDGTKQGLKITAKDNGPGIKDIRTAMEDGYSTSGGLGAGLPGVKRLMDDFMIQSKEDEGTEIIASKWLR